MYKENAASSVLLIITLYCSIRMWTHNSPCFHCIMYSVFFLEKCKVLIKYVGINIRVYFIMATYDELIRSECTSTQCSRREEIEKKIITTHTNTTKGVLESFHCMLDIVYSTSLKSWECSYVYFIMETYILIRSECTSAQCSRREEIEKQVNTVTHKHY